jgi:hypothetical protein
MDKPRMKASVNLVGSLTAYSRIQCKGMFGVDIVIQEQLD